MKAISGVRGRPVKFVLATLAVVLGVAFVSGTLLARSALTTTVDGLVGAVTSADVYVEPKGYVVADLLTKPTSQQAFLESSMAAQVASVPEVAAVYPFYAGPIVLLGKDGTAVPSGLTPSVGLAADDNQAQAGTVVAGNLPTNIGEIALERNTAALSGLTIGDKTSIVANGNTLPVTVVGVVTYSSPVGGAVVVILNKVAARALYSPSGMIPFLAVRAADGTSPEQAQAAITAALGQDALAQVALGTDVRQAVIDQTSSSLRSLDIILVVIAALAAVVAAYLIINTIAGVQRARTRQIATVKALGASSGQILGGTVAQAVLIGLIGSVVGVAAGFGLVKVLQWYLGRHGLALTLGWPWIGLAACVVGGILVTVVAAWLGAAKPAAVSPLVALRDAEGRYSIGIARIIVGAVLLVGGAAVTYLGLKGTVGNWYLAGGVVAGLIGVVLLLPAVLLVLVRVFAWPLRLFSSVPARLAKSHLVRSPRGAANVAGVFVVMLAAATALLILAASVSTATAAGLRQDAPVDYVLTTPGNAAVPDSVVAQVRQLGSTQVSAIGQAPVQVQLPDLGVPVTATVLFGPAELFTNVVKTPVVDGSAEAFANSAAVTQAFADAHDIKVGDEISFTVAPNTPYQVPGVLPVGLIIDTKLLNDIVVPTAWLQQQLPGHTRSQFMPVSLVFVTATNPADTAAVQKQLVDTVAPYHTIAIQTGAAFAAATTPQVQQARIAVYALLGLCLIVTILAIVNTLGLAVIERTHEFGLLKALGATKGQVRRSITFEAVLIAVIGALVGIGLGLGLAYLAKLVLTNWGLTSLTIPWLWLAGLFVGAIVVAWLAALAPAARAGRQSLLRAIAYE